MTVSALPPPSRALEVAFDAVPTCLAVVDVVGIAWKVNPAFAAALGYAVAELEGRAYQDLAPPADLVLDAAGIERLTAQGESESWIDKRLLHRDGRALWFREHLTRVLNADGSIWGGVVRLQPHQVTALPGEEGEQPEQTAWLALHDPLTGAANRTLLFDRIALALAQCEREGGVAVVLFCDVDRFKQINDTLGHARGDEVLVSVVRRLQTALRPDDTVARLGGDEFVAVAHVSDAPTALTLHARVNEVLARPLELPGLDPLAVGVSVGLATAGAGGEPGALLAAADQAMYARKRAGREQGPEPGDR